MTLPYIFGTVTGSPPIKVRASELDANFSYVGSPIATDSVTARSLQDRFADVANVKDFGALGNGSTNDTGAVQAAITSLASGGAVFMPPGNYKTVGTLTVGNPDVFIVGAGRGATTITTTVTNAPLLRFNSVGGFVYGGLCNMNLRGPGIGTVTSGSSGVTVDGAQAIALENLDIRGFYNSVEMLNNDQAVRCLFVDTADCANDHFLINGGNNQYLVNCTTYQSGGTYGNAAYHLLKSGGVWLTNCVASISTHAVQINPTTGNRVTDVFAVGNDFDNSQGDGLSIDTSGGGQVDNCKFIGNRFSFGAGNGITISGAAVSALQFAVNEISKNVGHGVALNMSGLASGAPARIYFSDNLVTGNASLSGSFDGYNVDGDAIVSIRGGEIGPYYDDTFTHQLYGVRLKFTFTGTVMIEGVTFYGNTTGPYLNSNFGSNTELFGVNSGFVTQRIDNAIVPNGTNSVTFAHGLDCTPRAVVASATNIAYYASAVISGSNLIVTLSGTASGDQSVAIWVAGGRFS